jgi:hypothetical protein
LNRNFSGSSSYSDERSATYLRRERLQKLRNARSNTKAVGCFLPTLLDKTLTKESESMSENNDSMVKVPRDGTDIIIFKTPTTPPKELDRSFTSISTKSGHCKQSVHQDECDDDIDTNLYQYAKERDEDEYSTMTGKSLSSFHTLKTCFTVKPLTREELEKAISVKQRRINLIHHALTCTHPYPVDANDDSYVPCPEVKHCHALGVLVRHVQTCTFSDPSNVSLCEVPGCALYKKIWNHYRRCVLRSVKSERKTCRICGDVWRKYAFDLENSFHVNGG